MGGRRITGLAVLAVVGAVVAGAALPAISSAATGDRTITGTIELNWGPSAPIEGGDVRVFAKACPDDAGASTCFDTVAGYLPATLISTISTSGTATSLYGFSLSVDSLIPYKVVGVARVDLAPELDADAGRIFRDAAIRSVPPGDSVDLTTTPFPYDTRYVRLEGTVTRTDFANYIGVGACPANSPFVYDPAMPDVPGCMGLRRALADASGNYGLNLWPGDWQAAGFIIDGSRPVLGVTNLLGLTAPPTTPEEALLILDFDANVGYNSVDVESRAPNPAGGPLGVGFGDGNGDGVLDIRQPDVTSLVTTEGDYITIDTAPGSEVGPTVGVAVTQPFAALLTIPPSTALYGGVTSFTVGPIPITTPASAADVDLIFHTTPAAGTEFWKYISGVWQKYPNVIDVTGVSGSPYTLRVTLTDGGEGDYDNQVNGYITDPFSAAPQYVLGQLGATVTKRSATFSWTLDLGSTPAASFPSGGSLIVRCRKGTYDLTASITGSAGVFSATFAKPDGCRGTVTVPSATPTGVGSSSSTTVQVK